MTEVEWEACTDPEQMLASLRERVRLSGRKRRLLACACCRLIWDQLTEEPSRQAIEVAERYADGAASDSEREAARRVHSRVIGAATGGVDQAVYRAIREILAHPFGFRESYAWQSITTVIGGVGVVCPLLREIFGSPFRAAKLDESWLRWNDDTVPKIAQGIYEERAFDRLPILADALLDAGCDDEDILAHCRSAGPHVRGCWAVDLILGKQ